MIHDLKPYPAYKDSGVPWLGEVPEHWKVQRLKHVAKNNPSKSESISALASNAEVTFLPMERISVDGRIDTKDIKPACDLQNGFTYFRRGDVLVAKITPCFENGKGACLEALPTEIGFGSTEFIVLRSMSSVRPKFLYRITTLSEFRTLGADAMTGAAGQQRVPSTFVNNFQTAIPPLHEQSAIVLYLDYIDRRIRRYIRTKQKLIKLLEEQKQAIIHQAVTRGLDPNVRLKPSGVEWLGDVPEHWKFVRLGRLVQLTTGFPFKSEGFSQNSEDIRLLRGINVSPDQIRWNSVVRWSVADYSLYSNYSLKLGDIVLGMDRPIISSGTRVAKVQSEDVPSLLLQRVARLRPNSELDNEYMLLLLRGRNFSNYLAPIFTGISVPHISPEQICSFRIALPPVKEQLNIVEWVKRSTSKLELTVNSAHHEISLLREYRTRLIADVVTGKLDVRDAAASLLEETNETENFDDSLAEDGLEDDEIEDEQAGELEEEILA